MQRKSTVAGVAAVFAVVLGFNLASVSRADPLLRVGIGLQNCGKIVEMLKPGAGLDHLPNALMFYWTQGYVSAANIHLLNEYTDYIDAGAVDEGTITQLVVDFCKDNADKFPVNALDQMIQRRKKIAVKESDAFDPWNH